MNHSLQQVRSMLKADELELFTASQEPDINALSLQELKNNIRRSRTLRDKYRDLHKRQSNHTQRLAGDERKPDGGENERTAEKQEIFAGALQRFEMRHALMEQKTEAGQSSAQPENAPGPVEDKKTQIHNPD